MEEKLFLFNPFNIKNINEKELASMYQEVFKKIIDDPNSRFKNAYTSTENKINALKKKLESIKFEEFNN